MVENNMLQRMSDEHKISFLETKEEKTEKKSEAAPEKTLEQIAQEQKAKKLGNKDNGLMTSRHISSARTGVISDKGGPNKYIKSETSNSIWDSEKTAKIEVDNKTKTIQEKEHILTNKRIAEQKRMDDLVKNLKETELAKGANITPAGTLSGTNYKTPKNNMSIFDKSDFQRLTEQTEGEKLTEDIQKKKAMKDDSWRGQGKAVNTKETVSKYFNQLFQKKED